jgi:hypothetical protein
MYKIDERWDLKVMRRIILYRLIPAGVSTAKRGNMMPTADKLDKQFPIITNPGQPMRTSKLSADADQAYIISLQTVSLPFLGTAPDYPETGYYAKLRVLVLVLLHPDVKRDACPKYPFPTLPLTNGPLVLS